MLVIQPRREIFDHPPAFRCRWRVERQQIATALLGIIGARPTHRKPDLKFALLRYLVIRLEVMRATLPFLMIGRIVETGKFDDPVIDAPYRLLAVVAVC